VTDTDNPQTVVFPDGVERPVPYVIPMPQGGRRPVVMVEDLHVKYRVYSSGKAIKSSATGLLKSNRGIRVVHALKGVTFTAYENESIGIIGANGSGKSTMMRAITGLTPPESGAVYAASRPNLLGVGAALIPDLSGERNIVLGGLALGLSRKEVEELRDPIVEFAELQEFIDLPMRTYSSGMQARLKFAIATIKHHEILIVDEALSVGDRRFRQRSESRIREIRDNAGTVFLVSHSMTSIRDTCSRTIWLDKGVMIMDGPSEEVVSAYEASRAGGGIIPGAATPAQNVPGAAPTAPEAAPVTGAPTSTEAAVTDAPTPDAPSAPDGSRGGVQ
jgi:teichoic acid transport system ATP-binding protein